MTRKRELPQWESVYKNTKAETMPWYYAELDPDLDEALNHLSLPAGSFLDLGTGPATQAFALFKKGYTVTGTDISAAAISRARKISKAKNLPITFITDNILNCGLTDNFQMIFDRGCFHVLPPDKRGDYANTISRLLDTDGYLFLKCFSYKEEGEDGPYRFYPEEIKEVFNKKFIVRFIKETEYQGTLNPLPKALFCVLKKA